MPPLPRVNTMSDSLSSTAEQRREKGFRIKRGTATSSQSSSSITGYEPMIELFISGSTSGAAAGAKRVRTYSHQPSREQRLQSPEAERSEKLRQNGCLTSPVGYDVFLSCSSSSELDWITQKAVPELQ